MGRSIRNYDAVIVCLSCDSVNNSGYLQTEITLALDVADQQPEGSIFVIPLRLEECTVPERLRRWQWVDYFQKNGRNKLIRGLKVRASHLGKKSTKPPQLVVTDYDGVNIVG